MEKNEEAGNEKDKMRSLGEEKRSDEWRRGEREWRREE